MQKSIHQLIYELEVERSKAKEDYEMWFTIVKDHNVMSAKGFGAMAAFDLCIQKLTLLLSESETESENKVSP
ncbi:MAG: hypothetical protein EOP48_18010 [Sphingobacteriales bacterium]|nr:MAG: hypothetical protein EOP48_18010 [Sphingobacteriales bacterium]